MQKIDYTKKIGDIVAEDAAVDMSQAFYDFKDMLETCNELIDKSRSNAGVVLSSRT